MADDMQNTEALQREIELRRADLAQATGELRDIALEKVDWRRHLAQFALGGAERTRVALVRAGSTAQRRPWRTALLISGFFGAVLLTLTAGRLRSRPPRQKRGARLLHALRLLTAPSTESPSYSASRRRY